MIGLLAVAHLGSEGFADRAAGEVLDTVPGVWGPQTCARSLGAPAPVEQLLLTDLLAAWGRVLLSHTYLGVWRVC